MASTGGGGPEGSGESDGRLLTARSTGSHCGGHATAIFARGKACCILWKEKCSRAQLNSMRRGSVGPVRENKVGEQPRVYFGRVLHGISKVVSTTLRFAVTGRCSREMPPRV